MDAKDTMHIISLIVDETRKKVKLEVDQPQRLPYVPLGTEGGLTEFVPELFTSVSGGVRFYPARKHWQDTAKYLGTLLTRYLTANVQSFEQNRITLTRLCGPRNVSIIIQGSINTIALPFELVRDAGEERFLILLHPFYRKVLVGSTKKRNRLTLGDRDPKELQVLIIKAAVEGKINVQENGLTTYSFGKLRNIPSEIEAIKSKFPKAVIIPAKGAAPTRTEMEHWLKKQEWDIVHYTGHGIYINSELSGIVLNSQNGTPEIVKPGRLQEMFAESPGVKLVYLGSCEGAMTDATPSQTVYPDFDGIIRGILQGGVGSILAHRWPVSDEAASWTARYFYEGLTEGLDLESALLEARKRIFDSYSAENAWISTVLVHSA